MSTIKALWDNKPLIFSPDEIKHPIGMSEH